MTDQGWAHPELLTTSDWVAEHVADDNVVVVDCDLLPAYQRLHIPGAVAARSRYWKGDGNDTDLFGIDGDKFAEHLGKMGIGNDDTIVAYDGSGGVFAARFWWTLSYYGHRNVRVLDGGWRGWVAEGGPIAFDRSSTPTGVRFTPQVDPSLIAGFDDVRAACPIGGHNADGSVIWDTRTTAEFSGAVSRNKRPGHVAGAVHLDWMDLMDRQTHRFKSPGQLRQLLDEAGITADKAVLAY